MRLVLLLAGLVLPLSTTAQPVPPRYEIEPCCDLCPQASNPAVYNSSSFLQRFQMLVQGEDGWLFRDEDLRTSFGPDAEALSELRRLSSALQSRGTQLVLVYQPTRGLLHADKLPSRASRGFNRQMAQFSYSLALQRFRNAGLVVPDLTQLLQDDPDPPYFFRGDHHWTPEGARRTAALVASTIRKMPVYRELAKRRFVTERNGVLVKKSGGTLMRAAAQICGFGYPDHYVPRYSTVPVDEADLFSDEKPPEIVLLGTSNSDSDYNFAGFLAEELEVDVLNASVPGGQHDGALLRYLPSEAFQSAPPKLIIWEFEPGHNVSSAVFWRRAVPLVYNGCEGQPALLSNKTQLRGARTEVLFNGGGRLLPLTSKDHVLDLRLSDPTLREIRAIVWYTNGSKDQVRLKYSGSGDTDGRFVVELRNEADWADRTFMSLDLQLPEDVHGTLTVDAKLCKRRSVDGKTQRVAELGR